jgi:MHS family alpha-ketoglutarate permease-like MFS transporter
MPIWSWRIPFVIGGILAFTIFFFRVKIQETDDYVEMWENQKVSKSPIKDLLKNYRLETLVSTAVSATYVSFAYSSMMFGNRLFQQAGYPVSQSMLFSMFDLLWISISIAIWGKIADKVGMIFQIKYGVLALVLIALPACFLISFELTLIKIYLYMVIVTFFSAAIASCSAAYVLRLFPPSCRYSGFSIPDSVGSIAGGFTPFMMLLFSSLFHSNLGCVIWLYIITIPTFILICLMNERLKKREKLGVINN